MIKVLHDWNEIGVANKWLAAHSLPRHASAEKAWDLYLLARLLENCPRHLRVIDLGCGNLQTLQMLSGLGFGSLVGVDLRISLMARLRQLQGIWRRGGFLPPFRLICRDVISTGFPARTFDVDVSVSTIEHGIDPRRFVAEAARILRAGGLLFVTTDYWESRIEVEPELRPFGLSWTIFDKKGAEEFVAQAAEVGFDLLELNPVDLRCRDRCVSWAGYEYTFIALAFRKR